MKCKPHRNTQGELACPHCERSIETECVPNTETCPLYYDVMEWNYGFELYECQNCGRLGPRDLTPKKCGECGKTWPNTICQRCKGDKIATVNLKDLSGRQNHGCGVDHIICCPMCDGKGD